MILSINKQLLHLNQLKRDDACNTNVCLYDNKKTIAFRYNEVIRFPLNCLKKFSSPQNVNIQNNNISRLPINFANNTNDLMICYNRMTRIPVNMGIDFSILETLFVTCISTNNILGNKEKILIMREKINIYTTNNLEHVAIYTN